MDEHQNTELLKWILW